MRTYRVTIEGKTPLLMHHDNIEWGDRMKAWEMVPSNKAASKAGDDRTPAFRWIGSAYHDGERFVMPSDNVMKALMNGGAKLPTGKGQKTFKAQTQSGIMAPQIFWALEVKGQTIPTAPFFTGMEQKSFEDFNKLATDHGFMLFLKRAKVGNSKHIRVRPRFDTWRVSGELVVLDEAITLEVLQDIGKLAGQYAGLGDWRPGGRTPGSFGLFEMTIRKA